MKQILKYTLVSAILLFSGCGSLQNNGATQESAYMQELQANKPSTELDAAYYARIGKEMVEKKEDPFRVLEVYKKLITLFPAKSEERQNVLRYILDENLKLVKEGKGQDALRLALELDKLIPKDFYVQNRIIGAYRVLAEEQIAKNNLAEALKLADTGLQYRFDSEIMGVRLDILILLAKQSVNEGNKENAKKYLNEVISIIDAQESREKAAYLLKLEEAKKMLATLK